MSNLSHSLDLHRCMYQTCATRKIYPIVTKIYINTLFDDFTREEIKSI
jgi:hypothetical protein